MSHSAPDSRRRIILFVVLAALCVAVLASYVAFSRNRALAGSDPSALVSVTSLPANQNVLLFRNGIPGDSFGKAGFVPLREPQSARNILPLACERLYFAAQTGLCLAPQQGMFWQPPKAYLFDRTAQLGASFPVGDVPSRTRVSQDGRYAAMTTFVAGDSYLSVGFSTRTILLDAKAQTQIADLETFTVLRDGQRFSAIDFNFWGVTFLQDSNQFYATLGTGGEIYLIKGDISKQEAQVVRTKVECPSISPDNSTIVYKHRNPNNTYQLMKLDLRTMQETPLNGESRSIDDQVEWFDNEHILYGLLDPAGGTSNIWMLNINDGSAPKLLIARASSPAVIRAS